MRRYPYNIFKAVTYTTRDHMVKLLDDAVLEILRTYREIEVYEFMEKLHRYCWEKGVICLKWKISIENGNIKKWCTDAWFIIEKLNRRGIIEIKNVNGRKVLRLASNSEVEYLA